MRRYLPLTLLLLAALSGQAFGAGNQPGGSTDCLRSLARLVQSDGLGATQNAVKAKALTIISGGLSLPFWPAELYASNCGHDATSVIDYGPGLAARQPRAEVLPPASLRMPPPALRGP